MPKLFKLIGSVGLPEVEKALKGSVDCKTQRRLLAIRLGLMGNHTTHEIAKMMKISRASLWKWVWKFQEGGIQGLISDQWDRCGRKPQVEGRLREELLKGLEGGRWKRAKEIQEWLKSDQRVSMSVKGVYYWLGKLGGVLKVPRKTHIRKNAVQVQEFKDQLSEKLHGFRLEGKKVRVWVADEHRYGLISVIRKCWTLKGHRPTAHYHTKYQWGYLYSALEVDGENRAEAFFSPCVNLEVSRIFLQQIAESDPQAEHVVIWDQAGFHPRAGHSFVPGRIQLLSLPAYSPELNPVEKIGDLIKDRIGNAVWNTLQEIESAIEEELRPVWQQAQRVRDLIGEGWLLHQLNVIDPINRLLIN